MSHGSREYAPDDDELRDGHHISPEDGFSLRSHPRAIVLTSMSRGKMLGFASAQPSLRSVAFSQCNS